MKLKFYLLIRIFVHYWYKWSIFTYTACSNILHDKWLWMTFIMAKSLAQRYYQWNKSWVACLLCGKCEAQWMCQVQCFSGAYYWWRWSGRDQGCPDTWWAGQSCAWLVLLEKTLQLWRNPVTGLSSILLKSLSCMTVMKKLPKGQNSKNNLGVCSFRRLKDFLI